MQEMRLREQPTATPASRPVAAPTPAQPSPATPTAPWTFAPPPAVATPEKKDRTPVLAAAGVLTLGIGALVAYLLLRERSKVIQGRGVATFLPLVRDAAFAANVPPEIMSGIVSAESNWNNSPNSNSAKCGVNCIASRVCAIGLAQVLPSTARDMGVTSDLCNPANSLIAGAKYIRRLYSKYGNWETAIRAYNAGPGNVDRGNVGSGTIAYADKVLREADRFKRQGLAGITRSAVRPRLFAPRPRFAA